MHESWQHLLGISGAPTPFGSELLQVKAEEAALVQCVKH